HPVALGHLPAVVQRRPSEAEALGHGERAHDLVRSEVAAVAPRAPDGLVGARRSPGLHEALPGHERAIVRERLEVVAAVHGDERPQGVEGLAGPERPRALLADLDRLFFLALAR